MKPDKQRLKSLGILFLIGFAYYVETQTIGLTLKCPLHELTGLNCPSCGITRACVSLIQGNFAQAFQMNRGFFFSLPVLLPWTVIVVYRWLFHKPPQKPWLRIVGVGLAVWLVIWGILRNFLGM